MIWTYVQIFVVFFWNSLLNSLRVALFIFWAWIIIKHSTILPRSLLELTGRQADKPLAKTFRGIFLNHFQAACYLNIWLCVLVSFVSQFPLSKKPSVEDDLQWKMNLGKTTFGGRQPSVEDNLRWKIIFGGRRPSVEDDLRWKMTFGGR